MAVTSFVWTPFAYAVKKLDTNDFFVEPDIWDLLDKVRDMAAGYGAELLPEIHEHYSIQFKIADHDYYVYDFALPYGNPLYPL